MFSVTGRIKTIKQPYGGYIQSKDMDITDLPITNELKEKTDFNAGLIGMAVDYLTRYILTNDINKAFEISLLGAHLMAKDTIAKQLVKNIHGIDSLSIISACKLVGFDVCYRVGPIGYKPVETINPDENTIYNIRELVSRSLAVFKKYGPMLLVGFTFDGGYTETISAGDGDYLTKDTLWDLKVTHQKPLSSHRLQLLIYYIMGLHSIHREKFLQIKYLALYNPIFNRIYSYELKKLDPRIIKEIEKHIICYNKKFSEKNIKFESKMIIK